MTVDRAHLQVQQGPAPHAYGPNLVLHSHPYALSILSRLGSPQTRQPEIGALCNRAFEYLFSQVANIELPTTIRRIPTRMTTAHPAHAYEGVVLVPDTRIVVVDVARAGIMPAQLFYERFNELLNPDNVRQDHLFVSRSVNASGQVTGASVAAAKVGGPLTDSILFVPDPMGATGGSLVEALSHYQRTGAGKPDKVVCVHLIVTPEYVQRVHATHPEVRIHAIRLDRGFSSPDALNEVPGTFPEQERGLDSHQYIVPGAGGLGEVLNNAWV